MRYAAGNESIAATAAATRLRERLGISAAERGASGRPGAKKSAVANTRCLASVATVFYYVYEYAETGDAGEGRERAEPAR
jgi:hypothetical protein